VLRHFNEETVLNLDHLSEATPFIPNLCDKEVLIPEAKTDSNLKSLASYQQELKKLLPEEVFQRNPARLGYFLTFLAINVSLIAFVLTMNPAWYVKLLIAFAIGQLNTSLGFFAHETLHGSVVKSRFLQDAIGAVALTPFFVSPTYWRFWHNTLHHGNTQLIYKDPDAFPTLSVYKRSKFMRFVFDLSPGSKNPVSYFYFFYWFSFQSILNHSYMRFKNKMWANMDHAKVTREFIFILVALGSYVYFVGRENFLWLVLIPFLVQNYSILSYISTNHNISPLTKVNDPLENSLTVTTNPIQEMFHLNFGYHVEHHLFPRVSCAHSKKIHKLLVEHYPTKYKHMPKWKALKYLYQTPRIYKNSNELIHPKTLETYKTI
jgi:fatty acid desaturase